MERFNLVSLFDLGGFCILQLQLSREDWTESRFAHAGRNKIRAERGEKERRRKRQRKRRRSRSDKISGLWMYPKYDEGGSQWKCMSNTQVICQAAVAITGVK
jgi:hypothetical protein